MVFEKERKKRAHHLFFFFLFRIKIGKGEKKVTARRERMSDPPS